MNLKQIIESGIPNQDKLIKICTELKADYPIFSWLGIYWLSGQGQTLKLGSYVGPETEHTHIDIGVGVCGTAVVQNKSQHVPDVSALGNYLACSVSVKSEYVALIRNNKGDILGQLDIDFEYLNPFSPEIIQQIEHVAQNIGLAIEEGLIFPENE